MAKAAPEEDDKSFSLEEYKRMFDAARTDMLAARTDSELSRDFYDGDQWTKAEEATILSRGQIPIKINRVQRAVDGIMGVVETSKTDPRALMRNPPDEQQQNPGSPSMPGQQQPGQPQPGMPPQQGPGMPPVGAPGPAAPPKPKLDAGDVATMTLRYIADTTQFKTTTKMDVLENGIVEGCGAAIVEVDGKTDVTVTQIRWEEFFYDPKSRRFDFQDARYKGIAKWMYADDLASLYPKEKDAIATFQSDGAAGLGLDNTFGDRPENSLTPWIDRKMNRLMVVDMYHQTGGQWNRCVFYAGGKLESGPSAYKDDDNKPCCPIEGWSCYINRKNERYGIVKMMRDPQKGLNTANSKSLHEMNTRQVQQVDPNSPSVDVDAVRREAAKPDGVLPSGWQVVPRQDVIANNMEQRSWYISEMERMGSAPSVLARQGADASGRAQQIRTQTGLQELARVLNRHTEWENRIYKQAWWRARQFWQGPKWIRVTGDNQAPEYVRVNEPVNDPMTGQPVGMNNHIAKMDVDIILDRTPDTATLEQEIFAELAQLAKVYGPQAVPFSVMIEMSSLPKKREILQKLADVQAAQAPQQQMAMQAQMAKFAAELEEIKANIRQKNSQADLNEANTVTTAMKGHLEVTKAAQLPPGVVLNSSGTPVPVIPPPPGANGRNGPPPS